jgi:hypothetical protein
MNCKGCGQYHERVQLEAVRRPLDPNIPFGEGAVTQPLNAYSRWACDRCSKYHFPDGSPYSDPFTNDEAGQ